MTPTYLALEGYCVTKGFRWRFCFFASVSFLFLCLNATNAFSAQWASSKGQKPLFQMLNSILIFFASVKDTKSLHTFTKILVKVLKKKISKECLSEHHLACFRTKMLIDYCIIRNMSEKSNNLHRTALLSKILTKSSKSKTPPKIKLRIKNIFFL